MTLWEGYLLNFPPFKQYFYYLIWEIIIIFELCPFFVILSKVTVMCEVYASSSSRFICFLGGNAQYPRLTNVQFIMPRLDFQFILPWSICTFSLFLATRTKQCLTLLKCIATTLLWLINPWSIPPLVKVHCHYLALQKNILNTSPLSRRITCHTVLVSLWQYLRFAFSHIPF